MGIVPGPKEASKTPGTKRRSTLVDFSGLGPLKSTGTVGFSAFRDQETEAAKRRKARRKSNGNGGHGMDEDSDDDDDDDDANPLAKMQDVDDKVVKSNLGPEDAKVTGELQAGIDRIRVSSHPLPPSRPTSHLPILISSPAAQASAFHRARVHWRVQQPRITWL